MSQHDKVIARLKKKQHKWLVTGAAGFIGSNLVEKLLSLGQHVVALDNLSTGFEANISEALTSAKKINNQAEQNFEFIKGDIRDIKTCIRICTGVEFILHQAALGSVPRSLEDPIATNESNVQGFLNMLNAARKEKTNKFVYASSSSVYGDHPDLPKVEEKTGSLLSPYAVSKYTNELYANVFYKNYGYASVGLRYFNIFGKRQNPRGAYAGVIPKWIVKMKNSEQIDINGDGETTRDFCYIENVLQANLLACFSNQLDATGNIFNIANNDRTSLNKLSRMISKRLNNHIENLKIPEPNYREERLGDIKDSQANITKAEKLLGYSPTHNISRGLDHTIEWYVDSSY